MLSPDRVLDLTGNCGEIAGTMLGDLGADVIRVEPPGGSQVADAERIGDLGWVFGQSREPKILSN